MRSRKNSLSDCDVSRKDPFLFETISEEIDSRNTGVTSGRTTAFVSLPRINSSKSLQTLSEPKNDDDFVRVN